MNTAPRAEMHIPFSRQTESMTLVSGMSTCPTLNSQEAVPSSEDSVQTNQGQKSKVPERLAFRTCPWGIFLARTNAIQLLSPVLHGFEASWKGDAVWARFSHEGLVHLETRTPPPVLVLSRCGLRAPGEEPCPSHAGGVRGRAGGSLPQFISGPLGFIHWTKAVYFVSMKLRTKHTRKMGFSILAFPHP